MESRLVSVILPVYNGEKFLGEAIQSLLAQSYRPIQIIVVDDGSTDDSGNIAKSFSEVEYHYKPNGGVATARNMALKQVRGEFIAFLDADDLWVPEKLAEQVAWLDAHPECGLVFAYERFFVNPGAEAPKWFGDELLQNDHNAFVPSTLLIRRVAADATGEFSTNFNHEDDLEWFMRAKDLGFGMAVLPKTLVLRRIHGSNISMQKKPDRKVIMGLIKDSILRQRLQNKKK